MTRITIYREEKSGKHQGFCIEGHSGYADSGEDIVCSAISILSIHTQNAIEQFCNEQFEQEIDEEAARMRFLIKGLPKDDAELLLKSAAMSFEGIRDEYPDYVEIDYREV